MKNWLAAHLQLDSARGQQPQSHVGVADTHSISTSSQHRTRSLCHGVYIGPLFGEGKATIQRHKIAQRRLESRYRNRCGVGADLQRATHRTHRHLGIHVTRGVVVEHFYLRSGDGPKADRQVQDRSTRSLQLNPSSSLQPQDQIRTRHTDFNTTRGQQCTGTLGNHMHVGVTLREGEVTFQAGKPT